MPEQDWNGFADDTVLLDSDVLLVARGASGINIPGSAILKKDASGFVGVGIAPSFRFHVKGAIDTTHFVIAGLSKAIRFQTISTGSIMEGVDHTGGASYQPMTIGGSEVNLSISGSTRAFLDSNGNLNVGRSAALAAARMTVERDGSAGAPALSLNHSAPSGTRYLAAFYITGVEVGSIISTGTTTAYQTSSDYRLKDNIVDLEGSGELIDALRPRRGIWKADGSDFCGFIAHEFAEVFPASVSGEKDGTEIRTIVDEATGKETEIEVPKMQAMQASSSEVIAVVIAELQSLRRRLAETEAKLEALSQ